MENSKFKNNMARYYKLNQALSEHGLELSCGAVIDTTLQPYMNQFVCTIEYKHIDLNSEINLAEFKDVREYIHGGREKRIANFKKEQGHE